MLTLPLPYPISNFQARFSVTQKTATATATTTTTIIIMAATKAEIKTATTIMAHTYLCGRTHTTVYTLKKVGDMHM